MILQVAPDLLNPGTDMLIVAIMLLVMLLVVILETNQPVALGLWTLSVVVLIITGILALPYLYFWTVLGLVAFATMGGLFLGVARQ